MSWETFCMTKNCDRKRTRRTQGGLGQEPSPVFHQTCVPSTRFLIANPELEFHVNPIRINELKFPNRKYFAIFRSRRATQHPGSLAPSSSTQRLVCNFHNPSPLRRLIETPRLEFLATPTKQYPSVDSNRDKNGVLSFAFRGATSGATLTLRAPQSNLPASCFVRASLGEHS